MKLRSALATLAFALAAQAQATDFGRVAFTELRDPQPYQALSAAQAEVFDLGLRVLNTQWVPAGTARAARIDGLGPLFNIGSCDGCHNNGARGRGPQSTEEGEGPAPATLVMQLLGRGGGADPVYGHAFNIAAIDGVEPEGAVTIRYASRAGRYPDGSPWALRVPAYRITSLRDGELAPDTVRQPRLPPALYGVGLLERIADDRRLRWAADPRARRDGIRGTAAGRFGWQGTSVSVAEQTARAFSREMGLTSGLVASDDCTPAQERCRLPDGGTPEVSAELFDALLAFQRYLAVPVVPRDAVGGGKAGAALFTAAGCDLCHRPAATVRLDDGRLVAIAPYTDLLLHDLGEGLADRDGAGRVAASRWRTAPLWGIGLAPRATEAAYLHDGRAVSLEQAVLWHDGEAAVSRRRFERFTAAERARLLAWLAQR
ncbi:MAG: di-heme oxidoredictase family protein [Solimonas sp.]